METKSFFGPQGLTSTSANYYCNMAKESARIIKNSLDNVRFYSESVNVIGSSEGGLISEGINSKKLHTISDGLKLLSGLNAFTAFLREAIKEKERLYKEASAWTDEDARKEFKERLDAHELVKPDAPVYITEDDVKKTWTIGEQEKYLSLEAEAAAYGKYIHEDGPISRARVTLMNKIANPKAVDVNGRDTIFYTFTPTVGIVEVDRMFFDLQDHYRNVQAELNGMKKKIQDTIDAHRLRVDEEYREGYAAWSREKKDILREEQDIINREKIQRTKMCDEIMSLKIVVPNRHKEVYDYLSGLDQK